MLLELWVGFSRPSPLGVVQGCRVLEPRPRLHVVQYLGQLYYMESHMSSRAMEFRITDRQYARLRNWQRAVEEKIRKREIETELTWDGRPISKQQIAMLRNGTASVHWGYCTEPYSFEFKPELPNATAYHAGVKNRFLDGPMVYVRVTNNVTGDVVDLNEAFSEWDDPLGEPSPILLIGLALPDPVRVFRHFRFRVFGPPKPKGPIELGGIPAGSDLP